MIRDRLSAPPGGASSASSTCVPPIKPPTSAWRSSCSSAANRPKVCFIFDRLIENLLSRRDPHAAAHNGRQHRRVLTTTGVSRESAPAPAPGRRALPPSPGPAPAAIPEALPGPPVLDLPPFPILDIGNIAVEFTFDQSGFPDVWTHQDVAPAADVALRRRYAELRLQKGFDELLSLGAMGRSSAKLRRSPFTEY
jgi:hypothetical protein